MQGKSSHRPNESADHRLRPLAHRITTHQIAGSVSRRAAKTQNEQRMRQGKALARRTHRLTTTLVSYGQQADDRHCHAQQCRGTEPFIKKQPGQRGSKQGNAHLENAGSLRSETMDRLIEQPAPHEGGADARCGEGPEGPCMKANRVRLPPLTEQYQHDGHHHVDPSGHHKAQPHRHMRQGQACSHDRYGKARQAAQSHQIADQRIAHGGPSAWLKKSGSRWTWRLSVRGLRRGRVPPPSDPGA